MVNAGLVVGLVWWEKNLTNDLISNSKVMTAEALCQISRSEFEPRGNIFVIGIRGRASPSRGGPSDAKFLPRARH
ncbi:hypothetical protein X734_22760 [Mesorhizobium sp. L2C084A000]|nr:hypothetical protein X734_22760 [Mesorhizobium sp. L2C084A000]